MDTVQDYRLDRFEVFNKRVERLKGKRQLPKLELVCRCILFHDCLI